MMNDFMKYKFIKKSESELASEEIVNKLSNKLWRDSGYHIAYMLGVVNYLSGIAKQMRSHDTLSKKDLIRCIELLKEGNETPDEIKNLVGIVLEELKDKEN